MTYETRVNMPASDTFTSIERVFPANGASFFPLVYASLFMYFFRWDGELVMVFR